MRALRFALAAAASVAMAVFSGVLLGYVTFGSIVVLACSAFLGMVAYSEICDVDIDIDLGGLAAIVALVLLIPFAGFMLGVIFSAAFAPLEFYYYGAAQ